jgi:hypothetical protein
MGLGVGMGVELGLGLGVGVGVIVGVGAEVSLFKKWHPHPLLHPALVVCQECPLCM